MPTPTDHEWLSTTLAVARAAHAVRRCSWGREFPNFEEAGLRRLFDSLGDGLASPPAWSRRFQDTLAARFEKTPYDGGPYLGEKRREIAYLRIAHAVLTRDPSWVSPSEAAALAGLVDLPAMAWPRLDPPSGPSFDVRFAVAYPAMPPRARSRRVPARAVSSVAVERVEGNAAVPAYRLGFAEGPAFDVLALDGILLRPVFAPGRLEPVGEAEFAAALGGDDAWGDNPMLPPGVSRGSPLRDYARELAPRTAREEEEAAEALANAVARCGRLYSIDGVVHRETTPPVFYLGLTRRGSSASGCVDWDLGDLTSRFAPGPFDERDRCDRTFGSQTILPDEEAFAFGTEGLPAARAVLSIAASRIDCPTTETVAEILRGGGEDPGATILRMVSRILSSRRRHILAMTDLHLHPLVDAYTAMRLGDVDGMRAAYSTFPKHLPSLRERAEDAFLRALVTVGARAAKGEYGEFREGDGTDLDASAFG